LNEKQCQQDCDKADRFEGLEHDERWLVNKKGLKPFMANIYGSNVETTRYFRPLIFHSR
jgi:hypothetical protein